VKLQCHLVLEFADFQRKRLIHTGFEVRDCCLDCAKQLVKCCKNISEKCKILTSQYSVCGTALPAFVETGDIFTVRRRLHLK